MSDQKKIFYIIGDEVTAKANIPKFFDTCNWDVIPMPPYIEKVYPLIEEYNPDAIIFSLLEDEGSVLNLAQLVNNNEELEHTIKMYVDLNDEKKELLLKMMPGVGAVYMIRNEIIKEELAKSFS